MKVKDLPLDDRPREKLFMRGAHNLTDAELLAILIRTGSKGKSVIHIAQELIHKYSGLSTIASKSVESLTKDFGIGRDKAATMAAAFEISRRVNFGDKWYHNSKITSPSEIANLFKPILRDEVKEKFIVVCLNSTNKIIKHETISIGSLNASIVHPREVFKVAIDNNSANIILVHNHPSGNAEPSNEDIAVTRKMVEAGKIMDIQVIDHIIIAGETFTSLVERKIV